MTLPWPWARSADDCHTDLLGQITRNLVQSPLDNNKDFLPQGCLSEILTEEKIKAALPGATQKLLDFIRDDARKVFATVLRANRKSGKGLVMIMDSFREAKFDDNCLAIKEDPWCKFAGKENCSHDLVFNVLHNANLWDTTAVHDFFRFRWYFLAPVFSETEFGLDIAPSAILPFEWVELDNTKIHIGGFSKVRKARLHAKHQKIIPMGASGLTVAIKELLPSEDVDYPDPSTAWKLELSALYGTSRHKHDHLASAIAAFQRANNYYLVFEWADGGSLEHFWEKHQKPFLDAQLVGDVLEQLHGLADALVSLHGSEDNDSKRSNTTNDLNTNDSSSDSTAVSNSHWRHGDLKPDNILRFRVTDQEMRLGTLQIADLGLAKRHTMATRDRIGPTSMRYGTVKYEGPEAHPMNAKSKPRSRLYDVWSMGCIMLEFIIWLLYGYEGLMKFRKQTLDSALFEDGTYQDINGTNFYKVTNGQFEVNSVANFWMEAIEENDPEFKPDRKTALRDLLSLVKAKLLVVNSDENNSVAKATTVQEEMESKILCRASASTLRKELQKILSDGKSQRSYLFTGGNRGNVQVPNKTREARQRLNLPQGAINTQLAPSGDSASFEETSIPVPDLKSQYEHTLTDTWVFTVDNEFAIELFRNVNQSHIAFPRDPTEKLCGRCQELNISQPYFRLEDSIDGLFKNIGTCRVCSLLYQVLSRLGFTGQVVLYREGSTLRMRDYPSPVVSICRGPDVSKSFEDVQVGLPNLPQQDDEIRFSFIHQCLRHCDDRHDCPPKSSVDLPTRVIEVGPIESAETVRLIETHGQMGRYIALSHRWGNTNTHPPFSTERSNVKERMISIRISDLPETFQDAVRLTRNLGIPYLWIDSICIIQGKDGDWTEEAKRMEDVFSSAYCVIAATQASGTADGFLKRPPPREYVTLSDGSTSHLYICEAIDDFDRHVTKAELNMRGWVFQERALARRTIHFAKEQVYWECGHGIRCETLTKKRNNKAALLGDPEFPKVAKNQSKGGIIVFFEDFYKQYSRLAVSRNTDRPIAIAGLEKRLIRALGVHGGYGIFDSYKPGFGSYLGRSLLWKRASDVDSLLKIQFDQKDEVPSWSWMSYEGGIEYLDVPFNAVDWQREEIRSPWARKLSKQSSWQTSDRRGSSKLEAIARDFSASPGDKIIYDIASRPKEQDLKCVVVGSSKPEAMANGKTHYVLIVHKRKGHGWERIGVGELLGRDATLMGSGTQILIF